MLFRLSLSVAVVAGLLTLTSAASADDPHAYGSIGIDSAVLGRTEGSRGDVAYWVLVTPRAHFGIDHHLTLSVGLGLPLLQLMSLGSGSNGAELAIRGLGVDTPLELRWTPLGRGTSGPVLPIGVTPVLTTGVTCALQGSCDGQHELALLYGYTAHAGLGWQWRDGSVIEASYAMGHLWPGGHLNGEPALGGLYRGAWVTFALAF